MNNHILHEKADTETRFQGPRLVSLLDIFGDGRADCDKCGRWQSFSALTEMAAREVLSVDGWAFSGENCICRLCTKTLKTG